MSAAPQPRSTKTLVLWLSGILALLLITLLLLAPTIISTAWGKERVIRQVNKRINGHIEIADLSVGWFSGQRITGVVVSGADDLPIMKIAHIETQASLLPLLLGHIPGECVVENLELNVIPYSDGTTNLDYLLKRSSAPSKAQPLPAIKIEDVQAKGGNSPALFLHLTGKTVADATQGSFKVDVVALKDSGDIKVDANVNQFPVLVLDQIVALNNPNLQGALVKMLGNTLNINISQVLEGGKTSKEISLYKMLLKIVSEKAHITLESSAGNESKQIALDFNVDGIQATPLLFNVDESVTLVNPTTIQVEISSEAFEKVSGSSLPFQWRASTPAKLVVSEFNSKYPLSEMLSSSLQAALDIQNVVLLSIPGVGDVEIVRASIESKTKELKNSRVHLQAEVRVLQPTGALAHVAAEPFAIDLQGDLHLHDAGTPSVDNITLSLKNSQIALALQGQLTEDHRLVMTAPATVNWTGEKAGIVLAVAPLELSLKNPKIDILKATVRSDAHQDDLISLQWNTHTNTFLAEGVFDDFPIGRVSPELEGLFGPSLSGSMLVNIKQENQGPVRLSLNGSNGSLTLDGRYESGVLYLNKPLEGQFQANERLARTVFKKVMPVLSGLISADAPITFKVDTSSFALPIYPFSLEKATVGLATLDFGNMQFHNGGSLGKVLSALRPGKGSVLSLWFTPLYVHLNQGILNVERVDLLMQGGYPIAAWGNVDLANETIDMQIGLSAITIAHAFNVQIGDPNAYIAVPLRGNLQDPTLDKAAATAKIASLAALNQAGAPGMILGTVLQIASGSSSSADIPAPTTDPLPWAGQLQYQQAENSTPKNTVTVPIKAVSEGAGKLLKSLFR